MAKIRFHTFCQKIISLKRNLRFFVLKRQILSAGTICWDTNFHPCSPNVRLQKGNSVAKSFAKELQKDMSNPDEFNIRQGK